MDAKAWLTNIKPKLAKFAPVFQEEDFDTTDEIFKMKPDDITYILGKCDKLGISRGLRNCLEEALAQKAVFSDDAVAAAGTGTNAARVLAAGTPGAEEKTASAESPTNSKLETTILHKDKEYLACRDQTVLKSVQGSAQLVGTIFDSSRRKVGSDARAVGELSED